MTVSLLFLFFKITEFAGNVHNKSSINEKALVHSFETKINGIEKSIHDLKLSFDQKERDLKKIVTEPSISKEKYSHIHYKDEESEEKVFTHFSLLFLFFKRFMNLKRSSKKKKSPKNI